MINILVMFLGGLMYLAKIGTFQVICILFVCKKLVENGVIDDLLIWIEYEMLKNSDDYIDLVYIKNDIEE